MLSTDLYDEARRYTVRISQRESTGTGFLVGVGLVLTCHHVIKDKVTPTIEMHGHVYAVDEVITPSLRDGHPIVDLALLKVDVNVPDFARLDTKPVVPGENLVAFGFTDLYPEGDSALFVYEGPSVERGELMLRLKAAQARPGLSGAPLISQRTRGVVGIVRRSRDRDSDLGARAVPAEAALRLQPDLVRHEPDAGLDVVAGSARSHLRQLISIHERNIQLLEKQAAGYGQLAVPLHIQNQLDDERKALRLDRERLGKPED